MSKKRTLKHDKKHKKRHIIRNLFLVIFIIMIISVVAALFLGFKFYKKNKNAISDCIKEGYKKGCK